MNKLRQDKFGWSAEQIKFKKASDKKVLSIDDFLTDDTHNRRERRRLRLASEVLVAMFGEDAEQVAEDLVGDGEVDASFSIDAAFAATPKVTRRYGKKPGPNWVAGGTSAKGQQIWLWTSGGSSTPSHAPPQATAPTPPPMPQPQPPATPSAPPTHATAAPTLPTFNFTPVHTAPPNTLPAGGQRARATSIVAYNDAMTKLSQGQPLTAADKAALATKLTNMPSNLLKALHVAIVGGQLPTGNKAIVSSVRSILSGASATPSAPQPAATPSTPTPPNANPISSLPQHLHQAAAETRALALAAHDGLIPKTIASNEVTNLMYKLSFADRRVVVDVFSKGATTANDVIDAIIKNDPGHVGASPPGPPPVQGLVWNTTSHRWTRPVQAATPQQPSPVPQQQTPQPTPAPSPPPFRMSRAQAAQHANTLAAKLSAGTALTPQDMNDLSVYLNKMTRANIVSFMQSAGLYSHFAPYLTKNRVIARAMSRVQAANANRPTPQPAATPALTPAPQQTPTSQTVKNIIDSYYNDLVNNIKFSAGNLQDFEAKLNVLNDSEVDGVWMSMFGKTSPLTKSQKISVIKQVASISGGSPPSILASNSISWTLPSSAPQPAPASTPLHRGANVVGGTPATPPSLVSAAMKALPQHLQSPAAQIRAISLAENDGVMSRDDAKDEVTNILKTVSSREERDLMFAFDAVSTDPLDFINAVTRSDPGHVGPSPPGPPPRPGLVWNPTTHRWVLPASVTPTPATPGAAPTAPKPKGAHYQPPPPKLIKAKSYVETQTGKKGGGSGGIPATIDHTIVGGESKNLGAGFTISTPSAAFPQRIAEYVHTASGHKVIASWRGYSTPAAGQQGTYSIRILDGTGNMVSEYDSSAARDQTYIEERAAQVANWLDGELARQAKQKKQGAPASNQIAQFAHDYAAASGVKPGQAPFKPDATMDRNAVEGFLKTVFPKLVGSQQHPPHGGMDVVEHTMNIVHPANLRTAGLSDRDAELLRLGMVFHDVGKQYDPLDHEHPRKSAIDAEPMLWQFGLSPKEVSDTLAIIKWHDAYGDALKAGGGSKEAEKVAKLCYEYTDDSLPNFERAKEAKRINNLLMRAYQSDVSTIPGLTSKPVPGRPDIKVNGFLDVDKIAPAFESKIDSEISKMSALPKPKSLPTPKKPATVAVGATPPDLVAPGKKWGELVQRTDDLPIGDQVPYDSTVVPPKEVYDEARQNPDLNYARAFNMAYDGPTGTITTAYHATSSSYLKAILSTGLRSGHTNAFGHGIYSFVNGIDNMKPSGYASHDHIVQVELHTGRIVEYDDLQNNILPKWKQANPSQSAILNHASKLTAAALWAGYSTISHKYYSNEPIMVILDPARIRIKKVTDGSGNKFKGLSVKLQSGTVSFKDATAEEKNTPKTHEDYMPLKRHKPQGFSGTPRTS